MRERESQWETVCLCEAERQRDRQKERDETERGTGNRVGKFGHDRWSSAIIGETIACGEEQVDSDAVLRSGACLYRERVGLVPGIAEISQLLQCPRDNGSNA